MTCQLFRLSRFSFKATLILKRQRSRGQNSVFFQSPFSWFSIFPPCLTSRSRHIQFMKMTIKMKIYFTLIFELSMANFSFMVCYKTLRWKPWNFNTMWNIMNPKYVLSGFFRIFVKSSDFSHMIFFRKIIQFPDFFPEFFRIFIISSNLFFYYSLLCSRKKTLSI